MKDTAKFRPGDVVFYCNENYDVISTRIRSVEYHLAVNPSWSSAPRRVKVDTIIYATDNDDELFPDEKSGVGVPYSTFDAAFMIASAHRR